MKKKVSYFVAIVVNLFCTYILVSDSTDYIYKGAEFSFILYEAVFYTLSFVVLSLSVKNSGDSILCNSNIVILLRVGSKRKVAVFELLNILKTVFFIELANSICVGVVSVFLGKELITLNLVLIFVTNFLVKSALLFSQTILETKLLYRFGFVFVCGMFMFLFLLGSAIYTIVQENPDITMRPFLEVLNRINIVNYTSVKRMNYLCLDVNKPIGLLGLLVIFNASFYIWISNKIDILARE